MKKTSETFTLCASHAREKHVLYEYEIGPRTNCTNFFRAFPESVESYILPNTDENYGLLRVYVPKDIKWTPDKKDVQSDDEKCVTSRRNTDDDRVISNAGAIDYIAVFVIILILVDIANTMLAA